MGLNTLQKFKPQPDGSLLAYCAFFFKFPSGKGTTAFDMLNM